MELLNVRFDKYNTLTKAAGYITEPIAKRGWPKDTNAHNDAILEDFYATVDWLLSQNWDEYVELNSNTVSPATQNAFISLREYRVKRNGHYRNVNIYGRFLGGCYVEIV